MIWGGGKVTDQYSYFLWSYRDFKNNLAVMGAVVLDVVVVGFVVWGVVVWGAAAVVVRVYPKTFRLIFLSLVKLQMI